MKRKQKKYYFSSMGIFKIIILRYDYSPGRNGNPLRVFLGKPMVRGAQQTRIHGVAKVRHNLGTKPSP